jgi:hypothetical protein
MVILSVNQFEGEDANDIIRWIILEQLITFLLNRNSAKTN